MMSRTLLLLIAVLIVTAGLLGVITLGSGQKSQPPQYKPSTQSKTPNTVPVPLPLSLTSPSVSWANVSYGIRVKVVALRDTVEGKELITDVQATTLPRFILTGDTQVVFSSKGKETPATLADVTVGQTVSVSIAYNLRTKTWKTAKVYLALPTQPTPLPSPASR